MEKPDEQNEKKKAPSFWKRLFTRYGGETDEDLKSRRQRVLLGFLMGLPVVLLLLAGSAEYTSRPNFCTSCHYMEPFYESWQTSSHSDVSCVKCHFPPGLEGTVRGKMEGLLQVANYLGSSYTRRKPWAEIEDASCLQSGCHASQALVGNVEFKGVVFDHAAHTGDLRRGKELRCTSCHSQVVQGEHIVVTETTCFLCHMKSTERGTDFAIAEEQTNCTTCHNWEEVSPEHMADFRFDHTMVSEQGTPCTQCHTHTIVGDGFVPQDNCISCHFEPERLEQYADTALIHRVHIAENKIECIQCHLRIQHKIQALTPESELDCSTCHTSTHREQLILFTGSDGNGNSATPNPMSAVGLNCASCHVYHENLLGEAGVRTATPQSCETCHGEGYSRLLSIWEQTADSKLRQLRAAVNRVEGSVRSAGAADRHDVQGYLENANRAMNLVEVGKPVHNITFSDQLIRGAYDDLNRALELAGAGYQLPQLPTSVVPSECANCHTGIEEQTSPFHDHTFSHKTHVVDQEITCKTCHSNAGTHGQLILPTSECNSCHHQEERLDSCGSCHTTEQAFYTGTFQDRDMPDLMQDAGVECGDCHINEDRVVRPEPAICLDCHDEGYDEMAVEWQTDIATLTSEVQGLLRAAPPARQRTSEYQQAVATLNEIRVGSARGMHNYELSLEVLEELKSTWSTEARAASP